MNPIIITKRSIFLLSIILFSLNANARQPHQESENQSNVKKLIPNDDDIILIDENGKKIHLSDLKGKVVIVNMWATWCQPCVEEMPAINRLKKKFEGNDNIVFVLLNVEADMEKGKKFMKDKNYDLPVYVAADKIPSKYFQGAIPTTLIFNKKGELEVQAQGARDFDRPEIYEALKTLTEQAI